MYESAVSDLNFFGAKTGIVICAGDGNAEEAAHLIAFLRDVHKSKLPIDIAYVGDTDLTPRVRDFLSRLADDVSFIDLTKVFDDSLVHLGSYATKPFALLASRYPQTILMDADAVPFSRPDNMFKDYPSLKENGALFFHDRSMTTENLMRQDWLNKHLKGAGQQPSAHMNYSSLFGRRYIAEEADSAVVCIDKSRPKLYMAMVFACWMNIQEVREAVTWHMFFGEKESYWVAAELTGVPYSFEPWSSARLAVSPPLTVDLTMDDVPESMDWRQIRRTRATDSDPTFEDEASREHKRCTTHMVHATPDGREPLWANGGLWLDKRDRNLGLANWTHWYLGQRIDEAIVDFAPPSTNILGISVSADLDQDLQLATINQEREQVMATQPVWLSGDWGKDADGCPQYDETRWMRLDDAFRVKLEEMIHAVKRTQARYHRELG